MPVGGDQALLASVRRGRLGERPRARSPFPQNGIDGLREVIHELDGMVGGRKLDRHLVHGVHLVERGELVNACDEIIVQTDVLDRALSEDA